MKNTEPIQMDIFQFTTWSGDIASLVKFTEEEEKKKRIGKHKKVKPTRKAKTKT